MASNDVLSENVDNKQCPPSDEFALRIEYSIDDQYIAKGYREQGAPVSVRGDEKRVVLVRGDSTWERVTDTTRVDEKNGEKLAKEREMIMDTIDEQGDVPTPAQWMRMHEIMVKKRQKIGEARQTDHIWVEVPPPAWSFSYNPNVQKKTVADGRMGADRKLRWRERFY